MRIRKTKSLDKLLSLPYVHPKGDDLYVRVSYRSTDGRWLSKEKKLPTEATPEQAISIIADLKRQLDHSPGLLDGDKMTFDDLLAEYRRAHPNLANWYAAPLSFFNGRKLKSLTYADCRRFKEARQNVKRLLPDPVNRKEKIEADRKPATIHREIETLRGVLLFAVRHGWLQRSPLSAGQSLIEKGEEDRRDRLPTPEEESRLLAVCVPPRAYLRGLIIATRDTGLRRSALLALEWQMIDWQAQLLKVPVGNRYKRRPKLIGLTNRLRDELRTIWLEREQPATGRVFQVGDFKKAYTTACRLAGIVGLRFNDLRHGFATDMMEADVSERLVMKIAGHNNAETHAIYTNVDERLALQVAAALNLLHDQREQALTTSDKIQ